MPDGPVVYIPLIVGTGIKSNWSGGKVSSVAYADETVESAC